MTYPGSKLKSELVKILAAHHPALFTSQSGSWDVLVIESLWIVMMFFSISCSTFAMNSSSVIWPSVHISAINSGLLLDSMLIIPTFTRYEIAFTNSVSDIASVAHQPAVFFTQSGTLWDVSDVCNTLTRIISFLTKYSIAFTNSVSDIASSAHQPAVFFTQSGTFSANALGITNPIIQTARTERRRCMILSVIQTDWVV